MSTIPITVATLALAIVLPMLLSKIGYSWSDSPFIHRICRVLWPPRVTLADMPYDVIYALSMHLSVKDLCSLRQTSRNLARHVYDRSIWVVVLRDIFEVRPIPRLEFALDSMGVDECIRTAIHLASRDRDIRGLGRKTSLSASRIFDTVDLNPVLLPGGRHFVVLQDSGHNLMVHDFETESLSSSRSLIPSSKYPILQWSFFPVSSDELIVATATYKERVDTLTGNTTDTSHVTIYQCNPSLGTSTQLDHFRLSLKPGPFYLDERCIAIQSEHGPVYYVRFYRDGAHTPIMKFPPKRQGLDRRGSLVVDRHNHLIVTHGNGVRIFPLPEFMPITGRRVAHQPVLIDPIFETYKTPDKFTFPFITQLRPSQGFNAHSYPHIEFFIWTGGTMGTISLNCPDGVFHSSAVDWRVVWPWTTSVPPVTSPKVGSLGKFSGIYAELRNLALTFMIPVWCQSSRGLLRLDAQASTEIGSLTRLRCPDLREDEFITHLSYDEESGRIIMHYQVEYQAKWRNSRRCSSQRAGGVSTFSTSTIVQYSFSERVAQPIYFKA